MKFTNSFFSWHSAKHHWPIAMISVNFNILRCLQCASYLNLLDVASPKGDELRLTTELHDFWLCLIIYDLTPATAIRLAQIRINLLPGCATVGLFDAHKLLCTHSETDESERPLIRVGLWADNLCGYPPFKDWISTSLPTQSFVWRFWIYRLFEWIAIGIYDQFLLSVVFCSQSDLPRTFTVSHWEGVELNLICTMTWSYWNVHTSPSKYRFAKQN